MPMKTQYFTATSLDGFLATEDDSLEWLFALADIGESSYPAFIAVQVLGVLVCISWSFLGGLALWWLVGKATSLRGQGLDCGHFLPEEAPRATVEAFRTFFLE